jgi:hypothetical protein
MKAFEGTAAVAATVAPNCTLNTLSEAHAVHYNTLQYIFGIETSPGTSQRADSPLMGSS